MFFALQDRRLGFMKSYEQITSVFIFHCTELVGKETNGEKNMFGIIDVISLTVIFSSVVFVVYSLRLEFKK